MLSWYYFLELISSLLFVVWNWRISVHILAWEWDDIFAYMHKTIRAFPTLLWILEFSFFLYSRRKKKNKYLAHWLAVNMLFSGTSAFCSLGEAGCPRFVCWSETHLDFFRAVLWCSLHLECYSSIIYLFFLQFYKRKLTCWHILVSTCF